MDRAVIHAGLPDVFRSIVDAPCMAELDLILLDSRDGAARARWTPDGRFLNGNRVVQGGFIAAVCDQMLAAALLSVASGRTFSSINLNTTFHRAVLPGAYEVCASVVRQGRRTAYVDAEVRQDGLLFASSNGSFMLLD